jgi:ferritin-like metal-binding protein YciE
LGATNPHPAYQPIVWTTTWQHWVLGLSSPGQPALIRLTFLAAGFSAATATVSANAASGATGQEAEAIAAAEFLEHSAMAPGFCAAILREVLMSEAREWLVQWLRDAHAMEEQAETMLSGQLSRLENYPELTNRIQLHLDETKTQASRLRACLDHIGEDTSTLKDAGAKLMATAQTVSGVFAGDEVMKGSLASYTFEHMEIASYTILIAAANAAGEAEVARICEQNLREEEAMAEWLKNNLEPTTAMFLAREDTGSEAAKR